MAGELEHIRPTDPSYGNLASRTRNINFVDANGVLRSITHVYWSPTNDPNDRKLIWQRDHGPITGRYISLNNTKRILFKWVCPSGITSITTAATWVTQKHNVSYGFSVLELANNNTELRVVGYNKTEGNFTRVIDETFTIEQDIYSRKVEVTNVNITVTPGNVYWIYLSDTQDQELSQSIIDTTANSDYIEYNDAMWKLLREYDQYNTITDFEIKQNVNKIKASVNGVDV